MHVVVAGWTLSQGNSGASRRLLSLLRAIEPLLEPGERVTVLHRRDGLPDDLPTGILWHPIEIVERPTWRRALAERRLLRGALETESATVLEIGTLPVPPRLPCPVSLTLHDVRDLDGFPRRRRTLARIALNRSLARVACVTVPSVFTKDRVRALASTNPLPRIEVIPGGVDDSFLCSSPVPRDERPYFLHVGHLEPRKNLLLLLSAYASLLEAEPDPGALPALQLVGADHGEGQALHERAAMLGIIGHVDFLGTIDDDELHVRYAGATAVLMPSLYEGFGFPALEGLAVGVPVLVSDRGALPEVVGRAGIVLPGDDASAWTHAMHSIIAQGPNPVEITARKERARNYSWSLSGEVTLELWRSLSG